MNIKSLNGWQRLWVALTLLYGIVVALVVSSGFPTSSTVDESWATKVLEIVADDVSKSAGGSFSSSELRKVDDFRGKSDIEIAKEMTKAAQQLDVSKPDKKSLTQYKKEMLSLEQAHQTELRELPAKQWKAIGYGVLVWLVPSLFVLALGYLVSWVYRGFKETRTNAP